MADMDEKGPTTTTPTVQPPPTTTPSPPVAAPVTPPVPTTPPAGVQRDPVAAAQSDAAGAQTGPPDVDDDEAAAAAEEKMFGPRDGEAPRGGGSPTKFTKGDKKRRKDLKGKLGYDEEFTEHADNEGMEGGNAEDHPHNPAYDHRKRLEQFARGEETTDQEAAQKRVDDVQGDGS